MNSTAHILRANGTRRINVTQNGKNNMTITVEWKTPDVLPGGVLIFSIDGYSGKNNVQNLATGKRAWTTSGRPPFFDVEVCDLPAGAECVLHVW